MVVGGWWLAGTPPSLCPPRRGSARSASLRSVSPAAPLPRRKNMWRTFISTCDDPTGARAACENDLAAAARNARENALAAIPFIVRYQSGSTLKFSGKSGKNEVKFVAQAPTLTGPSGVIKASIGKDKGAFTFRLKVVDADTAFKDIKLAVTTSHKDFLPLSNIKPGAGSPDRDGYITFTATPVLSKVQVL